MAEKKGNGKPGDDLMSQTVFVLVVGIAIILYWRGLWMLFDIYLFPEDTVLSAWVSAIAGLIILAQARYLRQALI